MSKEKENKKPDMGILISEKAREYRVREYNERIIKKKSYFDSIDIELAFKSGATMFSTENANLREALTVIVESLEILNLKDIVVTPKDALGNYFELLDKAITKAKTLM